MTVRPFIQIGNNALRSWIPEYDELYRETTKWLERNVSLNLPQDLIHTVDKIIFIIDLLLPSIIEIGLVIVGGLALDLTLAAMAPGLIPLTAWCLYDVFARKLYPYDYLRDLNQSHLRGQIQPIHANPELQKRVAVHLSGRDHVMLVGPAGCGKTTFIHSLAQLIESPECPDGLKHKRIYHLDTDSIMNDPFNSLHRVLVLIQEMNHLTAPDAIIFIDEAHRLNDRVNGMKLADLLKPLLEIRHIHVIAATTDKECAELYEDTAVQRRFTTVSMPEASTDDIFAMLHAKYEHLDEDMEELRPNDEAIREAMKQAPDMFPSISLPDSAIKILRPTMNWKKYHEEDETPTTVDNVKAAIDGGFIEKEPDPKPSAQERIARVLELWEQKQVAAQ